jgi:F-type H+-transporting ATPase subunit alpha
LKLGLSQFRELASFAQFGSDLDAETKGQIERGQRLTELLKQPQYQPMGIWEQVSSLYAVSQGLFDDVSVAKIKDAQAALLTRLWTDHKEDMRKLNTGDKPDEELLAAIKKVAISAAKGFEG